MFKAELRKLMKEKRALEVQDNCAEKVLQNFLKQNFKFETLMLYSSFGSELSTKPFFDHFEDKQLFLPRIEKDKLLCVKFENNLTLNSYNILEPSGQAVDMSIIDICIVPGLAFDKKFNRLGYGKGYYDRFLQDFKGLKIGICFDFQIVDKIQCEIYDIKMDIIITDKKVYK